MTEKLTLLELNTSVQETIKDKFSEPVWVVAEISELKINRNGHCYLELIEKDTVTDNIIAKTRANIWAFTFRMLKPYFENTTGYELSSGIKILVKANVEFHELYGFSLNIIDIDPSYTLGDLARKRAEIINQLEDDGILNMNKEIEINPVPQKIAIISSDTAAGYQDFINQLENNTYNFKFYPKLFPAIMQGQQAEESIIQALDKIFNYEDFFDVVVIIRGGGSQSDLSCFDNYQLASNVAQFPLPVLTGIGHDKDESIVDIVANTKLKTPTAVAEFIIDKVFEFESLLINYSNETSQVLFDYIDNHKKILNQYSTLIIPLVKSKIEKQNSKLNITSEQLKNKVKILFDARLYNLETFLTELLHASNNFIRQEKANPILNLEILQRDLSFIFKNNSLKINNLEERLKLLKPENILKRGYSITYYNDKVLQNNVDVEENDVIITKLFKGYIRSKIESKSKK